MKRWPLVCLLVSCWQNFKSQPPLIGCKGWNTFCSFPSHALTPMAGSRLPSPPAEGVLLQSQDSHAYGLFTSNMSRFIVSKLNSRQFNGLWNFNRLPIKCSPFIRCLANETNEVGNRSDDLEIISRNPDKLYKTLELELRGHDDAVLTSYVQFLTMASTELEIKLEKV